MSKPSALIEEERRIAAALPLIGALGFAPIVAECSWIVDQLDDIESDLSAFHRIDDYRTMHSARFFSLALRIGAYAGAVQARELARQHAERPTKRGANDRTETTETVAFAELEAAGLLEREVA